MCRALIGGTVWMTWVDLFVSFRLLLGLESLEIPAVTQIRASDDYVPGTQATPPNWNLGGSSILAHALALAYGGFAVISDHV